VRSRTRPSGVAPEVPCQPAREVGPTRQERPSLYQAPAWSAACVTVRLRVVAQRAPGRGTRRRSAPGPAGPHDRCGSAPAPFLRSTRARAWPSRVAPTKWPAGPRPPPSNPPGSREGGSSSGRFACCASRADRASVSPRSRAWAPAHATTSASAHDLRGIPTISPRASGPARRYCTRSSNGSAAFKPGSRMKSEGTPISRARACRASGSGPVRSPVIPICVRTPFSPASAPNSPTGPP